MVKRGRRIVVLIATSADGYIARKDGGFEWLDRPRPPGNYGMGAFVKSIDTVLWGRKTYDLAVRMGQADGGLGPKVRNYVFSHRPRKSRFPNVEFVKEPVRAFARRLRSRPGKDIWMMGGAGLIASFLDAGEIDEFIISVIPVFIGEGIPLIEPRRRLVGLRLRSVRRYPDGVVCLHYDVQRRRAIERPRHAARR
jgi:dihydrofolate reductase